MLKAYPRHSVDISCKEYLALLSSFFCLKSKKYGYIARFERLFAGYIGTGHAVALPSARLGLYLLFKHFNFPENSEVIISPFTHWSIFSVIKSCKLKPVFVDINENSFNLDPHLVRKSITKNTKLLIVTHMWGQSSDMDAFISLKDEFGLKIIEDCAMACGSSYKGKKAGSFGDASIFSFGKAKSMSTFGGGMLCTNDSSIRDSIRNLVLDFKEAKSASLLISIINTVIANILTKPSIFFMTLYPVMRLLDLRDPYNPVEHKKDASVFLDDIPNEWKVKYSYIQAALGIEQLNNLDYRNEKRIKNSGFLNKMLTGAEGVGLPLTGEGTGHIYLYYALLIKRDLDLDTIRRKLLTVGVDSQLNELTSSKELEIFGAYAKDYPVFNRVSRNLLIIPNGINLNSRDIEYIGAAFKKTWQLLNAK